MKSINFDKSKDKEIRIEKNKPPFPIIVENISSVIFGEGKDLFVGCTNCEELYYTKFHGNFYRIASDENTVFVATIKCKVCGCPLVVVMPNKYVYVCTPSMTLGLPDIVTVDEEKFKIILYNILSAFDIANLTHYAIFYAKSSKKESIDYNIEADHKSILCLDLSEVE